MINTYSLSLIGQAGGENIWLSVTVHGPHCSHFQRHDLELLKYFLSILPLTGSKYEQVMMFKYR